MTSLAEDLRETNRRLCSLLAAIVPDTVALALITPELIAGLLSQLSRAGQSLRAKPIPEKGYDPELDRELEEYRRNVEKLRDLLPIIHSQLLAERARLEVQRIQVESRAEWARASRQTL